MSSEPRVLRVLRNRFFAGLMILIPIVITTKVLWWLFAYVDQHARPLLQALFGRDIPGAGFAITVAIVLATGILFSVRPLSRLLPIPAPAECDPYQEYHRPQCSPSAMSPHALHGCARAEETGRIHFLLPGIALRFPRDSQSE